MGVADVGTGESAGRARVRPNRGHAGGPAGEKDQGQVPAVGTRGDGKGGEDGMGDKRGRGRRESTVDEGKESGGQGHEGRDRSKRG